MKKHLKVSYHDDIAFKFGSIVKAILLSEIMFWNESKIKTTSLKYGLPLVYFSSNAINKKFKSINANTANRLLKQLTNDGILFSCIANSMQRDTTKSYLVNFAYYDAILNDVEYPQIEKDRFTTIAQNAVNTIDKNSKVLCNEILKFLVIQNEYPKIKNGLEIQNESLEIQNESLEIQNESTLPSNTPSNKTSNKIIITEKNNNLNSKVQKSNYTDVQLTAINEIKSTFKSQFENMNIGNSGYSNKLIIEIIKHLKNELKAVCDSISMELITTSLKLILVEISKRIDTTDTNKTKLLYLHTIILNEPIATYYKNYDTEYILSFMNNKQVERYENDKNKKGIDFAIKRMRNTVISGKEANFGRYANVDLKKINLKQQQNKK
jgi:hypothetical protein